MSDWPTVWLELEPPLFVCVTVVVEVLLEVAAPVWMDAELSPVLPEVEPLVAVPPVLPAVRTVGVAAVDVAAARRRVGVLRRAVAASDLRRGVVAAAVRRCALLGGDVSGLGHVQGSRPRVGDGTATVDVDVVLLDVLGGAGAATVVLTDGRARRVRRPWPDRWRWSRRSCRRSSSPTCCRPFHRCFRRSHRRRLRPRCCRPSPKRRRSGWWCCRPTPPESVWFLPVFASALLAGGDGVRLVDRRVGRVGVVERARVCDRGAREQSQRQSGREQNRPNLAHVLRACQ